MANKNFDFSLVEPVFEKGYTFSDIVIPLAIDIDNREFEILTDYATVDNAIHNIFKWLPGQRILFPEFGNLLYKYLHEPVSEITSKNLAAAVIKMLEWEPRITVNEVTVTPVESENEYHMEISYFIPALNEPRNIIINLLPIE